MTDIGVEVGQKMRSAIKAKLMELECYVDDELPDYIMVMVANKRTKSQMNDDLQLFLASQTSTFVDWLHIVLKKLKEVHVTNPNVFKKATKRKSEELNDVKNVKKEKKESKPKKSKKKESEQMIEPMKSLTDNLPLNISKLSEPRKIVLMPENTNILNNTSNDMEFDIPSLAEVNSSSERELRMIEKQLKNVKSRLGMIVQSDSEEEFLNIKAEPDDLFPNEQSSSKKDKNESKIEIARKISILDADSTSSMAITNSEEKSSTSTSPKHKEHTRIIFDLNEKVKRRSVLERLGKRQSDFEEDSIDFKTGEKKSKISLAEIRKEEEQLSCSKKKLFTEKQNSGKNSEKRKYDWNKNEKQDRIEMEKRESIISRLGVMSKVAIPQKKAVEVAEAKEEEPEEEVPQKDVPSVVKVKPRVIPPNTPQANKNLLLKAVAEAQRSIAQTPAVGTNAKPDALFTKKYQQKIQEKNSKPKLPDKEKNKLKNIMKNIERELNCSNDEENTLEYVPKSTKRLDYKPPDYTPSPKEQLTLSVDNEQIVNHNFIVTLDGIDKSKFENKQLSPKLVENKKRTPSPIVFDKVSTTIKKVVNVPDRLPVVHTSPSVKNKERCKYWPSCRQGEKCEFVHPTTPCKIFPQCKFGDKCVYIHPSCKFESSCTRRDCPYSHVALSKAVASRIVPASAIIPIAKQTLQTCKYFPNCNNPHCTFYHPRPCKFGKFCKNQSECNFSHSYIPKTANLTWRNEFKL